MGHRSNPGMMGNANFSPKNIPGVVAWWDSTDSSKMSLSGASVLSWTDSVAGLVVSGAGVDPLNIVTSTLNSKQVVFFPGSNAGHNAWLSRSTTPANFPLDPTVDDGWMFAVMRAQNTLMGGEFGPAVVGFGGASPGLCMGITGPANSTTPSPGDLALILSGGNIYYETSVSIDVTPSVCEIRWGTAGVPDGYVNGTLATPGAASNPSASSTSGAIELGRRNGSSETFGGLVGDVIVAKNLSTLDRQKLEGYLAWKFALQGSLPGGHPYKLSPP